MRGKEDPNSTVAPGDFDSGCGKGNDLWALRDISFEAAQGEILGLIGRNGAGKSTLLKIISKITAPTSGEVKMRGKVASLLEVGTGFHPELTGRENVYLNGSILGMNRREVATKFDQIVAFSEVEKFIDTPVKRYSSGMYVRLAFAVAAHLESDILLVDEVLAVGDAAFQRKCLKQLDDVTGAGRTVLFVSHNMGAITSLCPRTLLLDQGRLIADGPSHQIVAQYLDTGHGVTTHRSWPDLEKAPGNEIVRLRSVSVIDRKGQIVDFVPINQPIGVAVEYEVLRPGHHFSPTLAFFNDEGLCTFWSPDNDENWRGRKRSPGRYRSVAWIPGEIMAEGVMVVTLAMVTLSPKKVHVRERDVVSFQVVDPADGTTAKMDWSGEVPGVMRPRLLWQTDFNPGDEQIRMEASLREEGAQGAD